MSGQAKFPKLPWQDAAQPVTPAPGLAGMVRPIVHPKAASAPAARVGLRTRRSGADVRAQGRQLRQAGEAVAAMRSGRTLAASLASLSDADRAGALTILKSWPGLPSSAREQIESEQAPSSSTTAAATTAAATSVKPG